ncbi:MAG: protein translocase subunit SecF [Thermoleophilia bacterium]
MRRIDFMGKKNIWFAISGIIILAGLISLGTRGLNLSIDFNSGSRLTTSFNQQVTIDSVRGVVESLGYGDAIVQTVGEGRYQLTLPAISPEKETAVVSALDQKFGVADKSWKSVGPTFGHQVLNSMMQAIIAAWVLLIIYVSVRFEYKYAVATLVALLHDLIITVGVYSIVGREVTTATVAAVLTILGYSLYDTIIVFDRVRENAPRVKRGGYAAMVNESIWEVMTRSIITTLLTLLPVLCLFLFGGQTLKDFAFALLVGITSGAYSSIFVAAPILSLWKEHEKRFRPGNKSGKARARA